MRLDAEQFELLTRRFHEQGGLCMYCDRPCWLQHEEPEHAARERMGITSVTHPWGTLLKRKASREHIQRRRDGGRDLPRNIKMACVECNSSRHDATPQQHRLAMMMKHQHERHLIARAQEEALGTRSSG